MKDTISVFNGIHPDPVTTIPWQQVLDNICSDRYKAYIEKARTIKDPDAYREYKKKLPAVTFSGEFTRRNKDEILNATGFI